jgi:hypothetical protein
MQSVKGGFDISRMSGSAMIYSDGDDYIEVLGYQNSGSNLEIATGNYGRTEFWAIFMGT